MLSTRRDLLMEAAERLASYWKRHGVHEITNKDLYRDVKKMAKLMKCNDKELLNMVIDACLRPGGTDYFYVEAD